MTTPYQQQLNDKVQRIQAQFAHFTLPTLEIFDSPEQHYRMRAEFRIWHIENDLFYAMFENNAETGKKDVVRVDQFPIASTSINQLMPILLAEIKAQPILQKKLFEIDFLASLSGEMLVSMLYHTKLEDAWLTQANILAKKLNIKIVGRSRGQKIVLTDDFVVEKLTVADREFIYKQIENGFSQPNAKVCEKMLTWACDVAQPAQGDLLELYCGNGNFTLPLSQYFPKVLATELAKSSVYAAQWSLVQNQICNIQVVRLSAEEFTEAYNGTREFRRLKEQEIDITTYDFDTVFVDPPRAGIDDATLSLISRFNHIIYISCNPDTLCDNLATLTQTHHIRRFALFDQFPYTHHIESGVLLEKYSD